MMHYINIDKKRLCGRNNNQISPILFDAATEEPLQLQFITSNNQIVHLNPDELSGLYLAGNTKAAEPAYDLLFLSKDYTIENDVLTFAYSTYTKNFLRKITKRNQEILIEIGQIALEKKTLLLRDYALANPRVYIEGSAPEDVDWSDYYTKEETQELLAQNLSSAQAYADSQDAATLASATAYTDEKIAEIDLSEYVTDEELEAAKAELEGDIALKADESDLQLVSGEVDSLAQDITGKADKADVDIISGKVDGHIADTTIHVTAADKTAWNGKLDPSALNGYATEQYVNGQVSGKADQSALTAHTSDTEIHTTALEKAAWDAKQNAITADNKLDYTLLSGTPTIPTTVSQLTNDSGYQTASDVETAISGKQDEITANNKLDFAMLSGVPEDNPALVPIELKTATSDCVYEVDFTGKAIQKYDLASATAGSNSIEIQFTNLANVPSGVAPTTELQIPVTEDDVSTITLPVGTQVVEMPDTLAYTSGKIAYHDIVFRAEKDVNDDMVVYCNYAYKFEEEEAV